MKKYIFAIFSVFTLMFSSCDFSSDSNVTYKILHMQENLENDGYAVVEEETLTGKIGSKIEVKFKDYEGFTAQPVEQQMLKEGLSVPVYYERNRVTFSFNLAGGTGVEEVTKKFGTSTKSVIETPVKGATRFTGWEPALPETFNKDATFTATWNYPCYKVQYLFENADAEGYSQDDNYPEEIFAGIAGNMTAVKAQEITGFMPQEIEQVEIHELAEGEELPVVKVKYDRKIVTLFIDLNEGLGESKVQGKFGQALDLEALVKPVRANYEFVNYEFTDASYISETYSLELDNKKVLRAVWKGGGQARYVVRILTQNIYDDEYTEAEKYILVGDSDSETNISYNFASNKLDIKNGDEIFASYKDCFKTSSREIVNKKINGDETTRIDVYIDRLEYTYKFQYGCRNEKYTEVDSDKYLLVPGRYGQIVEIPDFYKQGYSYEKGDWATGYGPPPSNYSGRYLSGNYKVNWTKNNYVLKLDKNSIEAAGDVTPINCTYDTNVSFPTYVNNPIRRPGYFIKSWNTMPDGSGKDIDYKKSWDSPKDDSVSINNLTDEPDGEVTLYAQWQELKMATLKNFYATYGWMGKTETSLSLKFPDASRNTEKYYMPVSNYPYVTGVDEVTYLLFYIDDELIISLDYEQYKIYNINSYKLKHQELDTSVTHKFSAKFGIPKFAGASKDEDFVTNTSYDIYIDH